MKKSCTFMPSVKDAKGESVPSELFAKLMKAYGYDAAKEAYLFVKSEWFKERYSTARRRGRTTLDADANGEPTIEALLSRPEFLPYVCKTERMAAAESSVGAAISSRPSTAANIDNAYEAAGRYNLSEKRDKSLVAVPLLSPADNADDEETVRIAIEPDGELSRRAFAEARRRRTLNDKLRNILKSWGVSVGALTRTERLLRADGVTDFNAVRMAGEGLIEMIRLADGEIGELALPEEFSHIAVEALKDTPIVSRLFRLLSDGGIARKVMGDEAYDVYLSRYVDDERSMTAGDPEEHGQWGALRKAMASGTADPSRYETPEGRAEARVVYELIGQMVAERILSSYGGDTTDYKDAERLIGRLRDAYAGRFGKFDLKAVRDALDEVDASLSDFASYVMSASNASRMHWSVASISSTARYYKLSDSVERRRKLLGRIIENSIRRIKILHGRHDIDDDIVRVELRRLQSEYDNGMYEIGVSQFASSALEELKKFEKKLDDAMSNSSMNMKCKAMRSCKNFIQSYADAVALIDEARHDGTLKEDNERKTLLLNLSELIAKLKTKYESYASPIFVEYLKQFVGDGIVVPFGKMKGRTYTADDIAKMADKDISFFDRWLDSMAESGDWVLRMMDSTANAARARARSRTLDIKSALDSAYMKLHEAGYRDTDFMYEKDTDGRLTGEYISESEAASLSEPQHEYYKAVMTVKRKLDLMLPEGTTTLRNVVHIRKDLVERMKVRTARGKVGEFIENIKDQFIRRSDDSEFGGEKSKLADFEGHPVERLPIYYIKSKDGESLDDLSTDTTSTMLMYADMCCNYHEMEGVVDTLEFIRDRLRHRKVRLNSGGRPLTNVISAFGVNVRMPLTEEGENSNIIKRLDDWFESQVYGRYMKDEGEVLGIDKGKAANFINYVTSLNQFALNIMAGLSNIMTGSAMMHIEQAAGEYFNVKDTLKADMTFWKEMKTYVGDICNPVKHSKLALFNQKFNSIIDYESMIKSQDYGKSRFARLLQSDTLYFLNSAGELWLQSRCALSMAYHTKLMLNGEEVSLWDAYEIVEDGGITKLRLRDGVTKLDGTSFTEADEAVFTNRAKAVNQRMNGIYNYEDRCAAQAYAFGRLGLMFRKWIKTSLNRRYGNVRYNYNLGSWEEGYYRSFGRFVSNVAKDMKSMQFTVMTRWAELSDGEKANVRRAVCELSIIAVISIMFSFLTSLKHDGDDDDDYTDTWWFRQLRYQVRRLKSELGAMTPTPAILTEAFTILKSPAASIAPMEDALKLTKLVYPSTWTTEIKSGKYKGHSKAYKYFWDSPLVPMQRTIYRGLHPENSIGFFDTE